MYHNFIWRTCITVHGIYFSMDIHGFPLGLISFWLRWHANQVLALQTSKDWQYLSSCQGTCCNYWFLLRPKLNNLKLNSLTHLNICKWPKFYRLESFNKKCCIVTPISLKFVSKDTIYNRPAFVQIMAWFQKWAVTTRTNGNRFYWRISFGLQVLSKYQE